MNILFTCAGRRNYLINYFKEALNGNGSVYAADMQSSAPALIDADHSIIVPSIYDANYISTLVDNIKKHNIDAVISLNDLELPILSEHRTLIENAGAKLLVSNESVIDISFDKWKTFLFLKDIGLNSPLTFTNYHDALTAIENNTLKFPLVLKPRWGSASIGIEFPESLEELELAYKLLKLRLERTILAKASQEDIEQAILIQEKVSGDEYGMDVLNDLDGNYKGSFVRQKLSMRSGETDKAISVIDQRFNEIGAIIGSKLKHIGNLDCDVLERNGELYVLELNPRFGGGYPFSHEAGMNTCRSYLSWLKEHDTFDTDNQYKADVQFAKCDRLLKIK